MKTNFKKITLRYLLPLFVGGGIGLIFSLTKVELKFESYDYIVGFFYGVVILGIIVLFIISILEGTKQ